MKEWLAERLSDWVIDKSSDRQMDWLNKQKAKAVV